MSRSLRAPARLIVRFVAVGLLIAVLASCRPMNNNEVQLFIATNGLRQQHGLHALGQQDGLEDQARAWAQTMAAQGALSHSDPNTWHVQWTAVAENVGVSTSMNDLVARLEASPDHRANMLSTNYTDMAIGTARGKDGRIYAAQLFWRA